MQKDLYLYQRVVNEISFTLICDKGSLFHCFFSDAYMIVTRPQTYHIKVIAASEPH